MKKFFLATKNMHKLAEFKSILLPLGCEVICENDLSFSLPEVEETGSTFIENALKKAREAATLVKMPCIADDSGLCVDALNGAPGIYSARFAGEHGNFERNNSLLLEKLKDVPDEKRTARFVCAIACILPDGREITCQGTCEGKILHEPHGNNGFGYDPLFMSKAGCFGELPAEVKNANSHRAAALKKFVEILKGIYENEGNKC